MSNNTIILETEQIHNAIVRKLTTAQKKIHICVAWFTCKAFSTVLIDRLKKVKVEILISDHDFNRKASHFNTLIKYENCSLHVFPSTREKFMHNKFCCIDDNIIITGSYNWSDKAETNYENILIIENPLIARQYKDYFDKIKADAIEVKNWQQHFGHFILQPEYASLFSSSTKNTAREKLRKCQYVFPEYMLPH